MVVMYQRGGSVKISCLKGLGFLNSLADNLAATLAGDVTYPQATLEAMLLAACLTSMGDGDACED